MSESNQTDLTRREFVGKSAAAAAAVTVAPGVLLYGAAEARNLDQPASSDVRWGMLIDTNKCEKGCNDCVTSCQPKMVGVVRTVTRNSLDLSNRHSGFARLS